MLHTARMDDAAFENNLGGNYDIAAGYYGGPNAFHVWPTNDWRLIHRYALPIWVAGLNGAEEGAQAAESLRAIGAPPGCYTALDMETRVDRTYVVNFYTALHDAGSYRVWVYGSRDTVFYNPQCNGYWVADYTSNINMVMAILGMAGVRAVQYAANIPPGYDASLTREWVEGGMWRPNG